MFAETIIALLAFGGVAGWVLNEVFRCGPLRDENHALRLRQAERAWADEEEARNLARFRKHLGTPYRPKTRRPMTSDEAVALAHDHLVRVMDTHNGSRKATDLRVVS